MVIGGGKNGDWTDAGGVFGGVILCDDILGSACVWSDETSGNVGDSVVGRNNIDDDDEVDDEDNDDTVRACSRSL